MVSSGSPAALALSTEEPPTRVKGKDGVGPTGSDEGMKVDGEITQRLTYKDHLVNLGKKRFIENVPLEAGDITFSKDELGLWVKLSSQMCSKLAKQMENVVVVKLLGRVLGYRMLCKAL
ncbi:hypothetical protein Scep_019938 [Stephania cephalantha]|uniref:Uncharacterized protein n=1 Tax=Stephania cephalantha TaxID=152367 RepID=A0AAP0NNG6_9MAGN